MIKLRDALLVGASAPVIAPGRQYIIDDISAIFNGRGTFAENLIEYAGRVCYRSTARMGTAPDFVHARIREGHTDILEHAWISMVDGIDFPFDLVEFYKKCRYLFADELGEGQYLISGGSRAWLEYFRHDSSVMAECALVAPSIFDEKIAPDTLTDDRIQPVEPRQHGQSKVAMLAAHNPARFYAVRNAVEHCAATFMIEGVSRTLTHQLVRHRLGNFSMESQRYVDLEKGGWSAIVPPSIAENPDALAVLDGFWGEAEVAYAKLRDLGIRKEDARFILPNAAETRLVVTMSLSGWRHFISLRDDKAAQWEIRHVAQMVKEMLAEAGFESVQTK